MTLGELFGELRHSLHSGGVDGARFEAEYILQSAAGVSRTELLTKADAPVSDGCVQRAGEMLSRRLGGEPLQYILGEWEFYGLPFAVGEGVLIPRQDTETLVELALEYAKPGMLCADLCAGSGCIGIAAAKLSGCKVKSYELSEAAFAYLERNIAKNGVGELVEPIRADVLSKRTADSAPMFDIIVTNPPYLTAEDMARLQREVSFEPEQALFGGEDGLDFYRGLLPLWLKKLRPGGLIAAEIGIGQEYDVSMIFEQAGLSPSIIEDMCGVNRVVFALNK